MKNIKLVGFMEIGDIRKVRYDLSTKPIYPTNVGYENLDIRNVVLSLVIGKRTVTRQKR